MAVLNTTSPATGVCAPKASPTMLKPSSSTRRTRGALGIVVAPGGSPGRQARQATMKQASRRLSQAEPLARNRGYSLGRLSTTLTDPMASPTYILGISAFYHDSAAALLRDGEIVAAASADRCTRKKGDASSPSNAVASCLREAEITTKELTPVVFNDKPILK